jgi:excisionase family DNA binding protein
MKVNSQYSTSAQDMISVVEEIQIPKDGPTGEVATPLIFENLKWLTSREAVVYLRLPSLGALRNLVYRRQVPFVRMGRRLRFERKALDQFLESSHHGHLAERRIA